MTPKEQDCGSALLAKGDAQGYFALMQAVAIRMQIEGEQPAEIMRNLQTMLDKKP